MSVNANLAEVHKYADVFIEPEGIDKYDILIRTSANELFELGYNSAKQMLATQFEMWRFLEGSLEYAVNSFLLH